MSVIDFDDYNYRSTILMNKNAFTGKTLTPVDASDFGNFFHLKDEKFKQVRSELELLFYFK